MRSAVHTHKYSLYTIILAILIASIVAISMMFFMPTAYGEVPSNDINNPFYPSQHVGAEYTLSVPSLESRLTQSGDTATLYAPYLTFDSTFYDANKIFPQDSKLCWAASCSNVLAWYLDVRELLGMDVSGFDRNLNDIFNKFRDNWARDGYDPIMGYSWYFTGAFPTGGYPSNLINQGSGAYLSTIDMTGDVFSQIYADNGKMTFGNYQEKYPFVQDVSGHVGRDYPLSTHESFSRTIVEQLHYGVPVITINKNGGMGGGGHAVTLWGCDYDVTTGLVTKLYITDSDDSQNKVMPVKVSANSTDSDGVKIRYYSENMPGDGSPYVMITSSTVLYAPGVADNKATEPHTCTLTKVSNAATCLTDGIKDYYVCNECGKYYEDVNGSIEISDIDRYKADNKISALGHSYKAPTYEWKNGSCIATRICAIDGNIESEVASVTSERVEATCNQTGTVHYIATFQNSAFATQDKVEIILSLEHKFKVESDGVNTFKKCALCNKITDKKAIDEISISGIDNISIDIGNVNIVDISINGDTLSADDYTMNDSKLMLTSECAKNLPFGISNVVINVGDEKLYLNLFKERTSQNPDNNDGVIPPPTNGGDIIPPSIDGEEILPPNGEIDGMQESQDTSDVEKSSYFSYNIIYISLGVGAVVISAVAIAIIISKKRNKNI